MSDQKIRLYAYSLSHFAVDFCCALLILPLGRASFSPAMLYILYNYCAFALQMPLGILADKINRNALFAAVGCGLVAAGSSLPGLPVLAVSVMGIGNALFHVGGGVDVLNDSGNRAASLGIFVSPGALGLYLGGLLTKTALSASWFVVLCLMGLCILTILLSAGKTGVLVESHNAEVSFRGLSRLSFLLPALCLFLVVVLRSMVGMAASFPWKQKTLWGLISVLAVVLGKAFGGIAMDKFGAKATSLVSLLLAGVLFLFADIPFCGVPALFLFNMTMPVTLSLLAQKMPGCKGFSFGLLTFALFLGFLPVGLSFVSALSGWMLALLSASSCLLLLPALLCKGGRS